MAGKDVRVWGVRGSRIGDMIMAMPVYAWCRKRWPECYTYWQVARKHAFAAAPLFLCNDLIDNVTISDCEEGMGPRDEAIAATCHIRFNVMPQHPDGDRNWANDYSVWEESWRMAGLPLQEYHSLSLHDQRPHLSQWFEAPKQSPKTLALWPASNYGVKQEWHSRYPSRAWMLSLVKRLELEGYQVIQCGHPNDYLHEGGALANETAAQDARFIPFMDQVKLSLGCDAIIGTDSGSTLVLAAYESVPTIQLLTDHMPGHTRNHLAFASNSPTNIPLFAAGSADHISLDSVVEAVKRVR